MTLARLEKELQPLRPRKKIVVTNGCFDLMHVGHLRVLEAAKQRADILVVALNTDASVRRLKGPRRPLIPLEERAELMAALKPVDYVTFFDEDTPLEVMKRLKPDVLVKGGDWSQDKIVGREYAKRVVRVPLVEGRSTTGIVNAILEKYGAGPNAKS
jgi:rfaE bifunctional protein nucleotidyltransferase chain/domain